MNRQEFVELYNVHFDKNCILPDDKNAEKISTSIFMLGIAILESAHVIADAILEGTCKEGESYMPREKKPEPIMRRKHTHG